jgi:hypothetical protein
MAGNTNVSSLINSTTNNILSKVEKVKSFGDQIPDGAKDKLKISSLGKEADLRSQILKTTGDIIKLDLDDGLDKATIAIQLSQSSEKIYNKYFPRFPGKPPFAEKAKNEKEYNKESSESNLKFSNGKVEFSQDEKQYVIVEIQPDENAKPLPPGLFQFQEKNYLNEKLLLQKQKADLQQKLEDILNDPYKRVKKQRERRQKRVKERKQRNKKKREKGKKSLFKKVLKNARKSLTPIVALQGVRLLFDIILNNKKLQDLVDNTNAVIDAATTQQDINAARVLRNSTLSILNDSERKTLSLLNLVKRLNIIISILNFILNIALTIFLIPTPPGPVPDVVTPAKERFRRRYEKAVKLVDGLNVLVAIFQGILDDQLSELNDLKNQLKDINDLLSNAALNNLSDNELQNFINDLQNQSSQINSPTFSEYKGFKFAIKEEETLGAQQAIVVRGNIKRRYAVAIDRDGVEVLKSELSFTLDPPDLVEQLKLIIDQQNLQG